MAGAKIETLMNGIQDQLEKMLDRSRSMQSYLNRVVYSQYQNAQRKRWITEGASEGSQWQSLNPKYAEIKKVRFAAFPGAGNKMLIATGRLQKSVIGPGEDHRKIATDRDLTVSWTTPYAVYVSEVRPFETLGDKTMSDIYEGAAKFIMEGILRGIS